VASNVAPGGPAARAGLAEGDVVVAIGGVEVAEAGSAYLARQQVDAAVARVMNLMEVEVVLRPAGAVGQLQVHDEHRDGLAPLCPPPPPPSSPWDVPRP
jgi:predicted metalloprotease with PDZ domain